MKKKTYSKSVHWMRDAALKAFAVLALVIGGFYVYAEIIWPGDTPNPTTGVVGTFVGSSEYDGVPNGAFSVASEYKEVNKFCSQVGRAPGAINQNLSGSHICTPDEMTNSYNHQNDNSPIKTFAASPSLWINSGPPGYTASANDCKGWTATSRGPEDDPNFGAMWIFAIKAGGLSPCTTGRKFACCK